MNPQNGDDASSVHAAENEKTSPVLTRFQKVKAHLLRFKWWYLLGLVIFLAILLPLL